MKIIEREEYLKELLSLKNKPNIKIISGVRRAGKSFLMSEFIKLIKKEELDSNVIRINSDLRNKEHDILITEEFMKI